VLTRGFATRLTNRALAHQSASQELADPHAPLGSSAHRGSDMFVRRMERLPPLAWLLDLRTLPPTLVCGSDVEIFDDGFFEGCWTGDFPARDFDTARHVFGSGARQVGEGWLVVSPSHTMEAIYLLVQPVGHLVSNSLAFLCAWAEIELPFDRDIAARLFSAADGVDNYERELFQGPGWSIHRACFDNLAIGPDGVRYLASPRSTNGSLISPPTRRICSPRSLRWSPTARIRCGGFNTSSPAPVLRGSIRRPARRLRPSLGHGALSRSAAPGAAARIQAAP
jgi:hypothetical protein